MKKIIYLVLIMGLCQSTCKQTTDHCKGNAVPDCMCTQQYEPVCGCDGKTYGNPCMARCAGIKTWTRGECN